MSAGAGGVRAPSLHTRRHQAPRLAAPVAPRAGPGQMGRSSGGLAGARPSMQRMLKTGSRVVISLSICRHCSSFCMGRDCVGGRPAPLALRLRRIVASCRGRGRGGDSRKGMSEGVCC